MEQRKIQGYRNLRLVVTGPYWTLYEAVRAFTGTRVLLQVLDDSLADDSELVALFEQLPHLTSILQHEKILVPFAFEEAPEGTFLIYEFVHAQSLQEISY